MEMFVASAMVRGIITFLFVTICLLLIVVILLQKGRGGGLAGAFGGAGGHSAFGTKTGDVFTWVTVALAAMFVIVAIIGKFTMVPDKPQEVEVPVLTEPGQAPDELPAEPAGEAPAPSETPVVPAPVEEPVESPPVE